MRMSRFTLCAGLMALAASVMIADAVDAGGRRDHKRGQRPAAGPERASRAEALGLTEDQQTQIRALHETFRAEAEALRQSTAEADRDTRRESFQALRETHRQQFQALLTEEQRTQLQALHAERGAEHPARGQRRPHHRGDRRGSGERPDLGALLGLSEDQSAQLQTLRGDLAQQLQALRASGEADRQQARALRQAHHEQVRAVLTQAQRDRLDELRPRRHRGEQGSVAESEPNATAKGAGTESERSWGSVKSGRR